MGLDLPADVSAPGQVRQWKSDGHKELQAETTPGHGNSQRVPCHGALLSLLRRAGRVGGLCHPGSFNYLISYTGTKPGPTSRRLLRGQEAAQAVLGAGLGLRSRARSRASSGSSCRLRSGSIPLLIPVPIPSLCHTLLIPIPISIPILSCLHPCPYPHPIPSASHAIPMPSPCHPHPHLHHLHPHLYSNPIPPPSVFLSPS